MKIRFLCYLIFSILVFSLSATIINIPADQPSIQEGIFVAVNGDTLLVQPGTYVENINYNGKDIVVGSLYLTTQDTSYISQTIIDGNQNGSVVIFVAQVDSSAALCGFTITNGNNFSGGGIFCSTSDPKLENLVIMNNVATAEYGDGGGIFIYNSNPSLINVIVKENSTIGFHGHGGGIYCTNSYPICKNVTIINNFCTGYYGAGGGIYCCSDSSPTLENVLISNNSALLPMGYGGGLAIIGNSDLVLKNVSILDNSAGNGGGGILCVNASPILINVTISGNYSEFGNSIYCTTNSDLSLINCILWSHNPHEIYFSENFDPNSITITYSTIQGGENGIITNNNGTVNWLEGNIDENPLWQMSGDYPYMLTEDSPCIDAGTLDLPPGIELPEFDLAGNPRIVNGMVDMGAYEYQDSVSVLDNIQSSIFNTQLSNYPNPFNPSTTIKLYLAEPGKIELAIYNIKGQKIKTLMDAYSCKGHFEIFWRGTDENGQPVSSGQYFIKLKQNGKITATKIMLLK